MKQQNVDGGPFWKEKADHLKSKPYDFYNTFSKQKGEHCEMYNRKSSLDEEPAFVK